MLKTAIPTSSSELQREGRSSQSTCCTPRCSHSRRQVFPVTPGQALAAASQQHSGCELLLAHAASQQGEEQMAAYPFTRARLIVSLPYSVYGVHPALLKPRQLEGTKITSLRGFLQRLTAPHSTNQGHNLHAQPAESIQM